jgi:hypothetical protein
MGGVVVYDKDAATSRGHWRKHLLFYQVAWHSAA